MTEKEIIQKWKERFKQRNISKNIQKTIQHANKKYKSRSKK